MKILMIAVLVFAILAHQGCKEQTPVNGKNAGVQAIFPKGEQGPTENFTGKAWNIGLVANDSVYNTVVGNVYFEPGARSNWHTHPAGQILIITDGVGYHQIKGQPKHTIRKGDVVKYPPGVEHWHGASQGIVTWLKPVTDEEYNKQ
jgi:quercetin dioxygenase-like cupin family protein